MPFFPAMLKDFRLYLTSLRFILIVPFVLQIVLAVGLTGYFSVQYGERSIQYLANELITETNSRIADHLDQYLAIPNQLNRLNLKARDLGVLDFKNFNLLGTYFWQQMALFPIGYINYGTTTGEFIGVERLNDINYRILEKSPETQNQLISYDTDQQGKRLHTVDITPNYDHRQEAWYADAVKEKKPLWTEIYQWEDKPEILSISSSYPVYDENQALLGVLGIDLILSQMNDFLHQLQNNHSGVIYIMEKSGLMVANSVNTPVYTFKKERPQRLHVWDSSDHLLQATGNYLKQQLLENKSLTNFTKPVSLLNQSIYLKTINYKDEYGLDWILVVAIPELDFTEQLIANRNLTIFFCGLALLITIFLGLFTSQWVINPIVHLNTMTSQLAQGNWEIPVETQRKDELGDLARSIREMAKKLQLSFLDLQNLNHILSEKQDQLYQFLDALPLGIAVHYPDTSVFYFNRTAKDLLGVQTIPKATGDELSIAYHLYLLETDELYPINQLPVVRALQGETLFLDDIEIHQDHQIIPLEVRATPIYDDEENIIYALVAFQDIRERKQAEKIITDYNRLLEAKVIERTQQLEKEMLIRQQAEASWKESEERWKYAIEGNGDGLWDWNAITNEVFFSPRWKELLGYEEDEIGNSLSEWSERLHPDDKDYVYQAIEKHFKGETNYYISEHRLLCKDGTYKWILDRGKVMIRDQEGKPLRVIGTHTDISEQKKLQEELQEAKITAEKANRAKSEFLANISHELRTPLNAILGFTQLLNQDSQLTQEQQETITIINYSGEHLLALINDILEMAKIESGQINVEHRDFKLSALLEYLQEMFTLKANSKGLLLIFQMAETVPTIIKGDELKIRQILINLLNNSIKFTDEGSVTLQVSCLNNPPRLQFIISDTGVGIDLNEQTNIFNPFVQVHSTSKNSEGTGLGLSITQKFVELMSGQIMVASQINQGTSFSVILPLYQADNLLPSSHSSSVKPTIISSLDILIAEDNRVNQKVALQMLKRLGYTADIANHGEEVLLLLQQKHYDIVLMDIQMPIMDGIIATQEICQQFPLEKRPIIIALTANALQEEVKYYLSIGMNDYLSKPLRLEKLEATLLHWCKNLKKFHEE